MSIDCKATVAIGDFSRGGLTRGDTQACDHDLGCQEKYIPWGLVDEDTGRLSIIFGSSYKTRDFMVDALHARWKALPAHEQATIEQLQSKMDNGPESSGVRTQFLHRMVQFADQMGNPIQLLYYPPYHSKYNAIERYWAGLEKSWNGYLLSTVEAVIRRAGNFFWKGMRTSANLMDGVYEKGVKICGKEKRALEDRLKRTAELGCWDITIHPKTEFL